MPYVEGSDFKSDKPAETGALRVPGSATPEAPAPAAPSQDFRVDPNDPNRPRASHDFRVDPTKPSGQTYRSPQQELDPGVADTDDFFARATGAQPALPDADPDLNATDAFFAKAEGKDPALDQKLGMSY
jgi:hypothetical protein